MKNIFFVLCFISALSCSEENAEHHVINKALSNQLIGEWRSVRLKITMNTFKNSDSAQVFNVEEAEWEKKMTIQPIRTIYKEDGTYNSEHRNLKDSLFLNLAGHWVIYGDSLFMNDTFPVKGQRYQYKLKFEKNIAQFYGLEDADADGSVDDDYYGEQRKQ